MALAIAWTLVLIPPAAAQIADGDALSREAKAEFLANARVVRSSALPKGVTRPVRLTLTDGRLTHDAAFSMVDERVPVMRFPSGRVEFDFVDSYRYSIAAWRIAVLLGLDDFVPVTVERRWNGQRGAASWWIDAAWDEQQRRQQNLRPPDSVAWARQMARMRLFAQLLGDTDRNQGNLLITADWRLWMIDFTRAFRRAHTLSAPEELLRCDRDLLVRLRALTREQVEHAAKPYIGAAEVAALMARRDAILARFAALVAQRGESVVILD